MVFHSLPAVVVILTLALIGTYAAKGPFWAMVTQWCPEDISAVGIAVVSAVGSIAAALSTYLLGEIQKATGSFSLALLPLIALAVVASVVLSLPAYDAARSRRYDRTLATITRPLPRLKARRPNGPTGGAALPTNH